MTNEQYHTLIHPYTDAMNLILTRLEILNHCAADNEDVRPIHGITHRIKEKISMENKLKKKHSNGSVQDAKILPVSALSAFLNAIFISLLNH